MEIIGEALKRADAADATLVEQVPELRSIVGLRNRIIHGYDAVDDELVWDVVQSKLPALARALEAVLGEDEAGKMSCTP